MGHPMGYSTSPSNRLAGCIQWRPQSLHTIGRRNTRQTNSSIYAMSITDSKIQAALTLLGAHDIDPSDYGYPQPYLEACGVRFFTSREMTSPGKSALALGYADLIPPTAWWPRGALLALIADRCRDAAGAPVRMRNWWRPKDVNARGGGTTRSAHIPALAVDLDYRTRAQRARAVKRVIRPLYGSGLLEMGLGIGWRTTHIDCFSEHGQRFWKYSKKVLRPSWA